MFDIPKRDNEPVNWHVLTGVLIVIGLVAAFWGWLSWLILG